MDELIALADAIEAETKVDRLLTMIAEEFAPREPVLLFAEYKATQALVVALQRRFTNKFGGVLAAAPRLRVKSRR